jgi:hypothetical protein
MAGRADLDRALADPNAYFRCLDRQEPGEENLSRARHDLVARNLNDYSAQALFDRPNLRSGISGGFTLSSSSEASLSYARPFILRSRWSPDDVFTGFQPRLLTPFVTVTTPLDKDKNVGRLFSDTDRPTRANADIPSGTRVRVGFDFLSYPMVSARLVKRRLHGDERADQIHEQAGLIDERRSFAARRRVVDVLYTARQACYKHYGQTLPETDHQEFYDGYGAVRVPEAVNTIKKLPPVPAATPAAVAPINRADAYCRGNRLVDFLTATQTDATTRSGNTFVNAPLAASYLDAFWGAGTGVLPQWGWGASFEYGTRDFTFRQADPISYTAQDAVTGRTIVELNRAGEFAVSDTKEHPFGTVRAYGLFNVGALAGTRLTDILLVGSGEYSWQHLFRPGTEGLTTCPNMAATINCSVANVDAPQQVDGFTLALETRVRFRDIPFLQSLSLAPRYSHRLDDGAQTIDIPVYLQNDTNGLGTAGVRFRHSWGGRDLLGNRDLAASEFSLFFVPIKFSGP